MTGERRRARDEGWLKRFGIAQMGRGMPGEAAYGMGSAARNFQNIADTGYARQSMDAANIGYLIAPAAQKITDWFRNKSAPPSSTVVTPPGTPQGINRIPIWGGDQSYYAS